MRSLKKRNKKIIKWVIIFLSPSLLPLIICILVILPFISLQVPNLDQALIPSYKKYADLMGADWQLMIAYDLAINKNQAEYLDPEKTAWFFLTVKYEDVYLSGRDRINDFFGEKLNFEEAMDKFIQMNQTSGVDIYEIGSKDIVSLEYKLSDEEYKWVESLIANNIISRMGGDKTFQGASYQKLVFENKGYFAMPLAAGTYTVSTRGFGYRMHPIKKVMKFHSGQDFGAATGTPVGASADGVAYVRWDADGYGKYVIINHPNGMSTLYAHLSEVLVAKGQNVTKGDEIGLVGSTGGSTGPHLHFEIRTNGQYLDPMKFLK